MSDPSDKSRRDGSDPLPRTNRPRPESARRRSDRKSGGIDSVTPPPVSASEERTSDGPISGATPAARVESFGEPRTHVFPSMTPPPATVAQDENAALIGERPTQLAVGEPISAKISVTGTLKHVTLEMATPAPPQSGRPHGAAYLDSVIDGRYRIDGVLGRGGMGVVYRARHEVLDKLFAIKILLPTEDNDVVERFVNEARAATAIGNEHIVDTVDFGQLPDGSTYFVMEYLEGRTLSQRIKAERTIPVSTSISFGKQIAEGMSAAHRAGIVHRDLKPENIFLIGREAEEDFVKLLDFGIAKMQARENKLTRAGTIFGTPHYMSPEQASASEVDTRADVYSLGVILYEMLAGQVPFDAENPMGLLTQHLYAAPVPLTARENAPQVISVDLDAVVLTCLAKQPEDRYASMEDLLVDLAHVEAGTPPAALARLVAQGDRASSEPLVRNAKRRLRASSIRWPLIGGAALVAFVGALVITTLVKKERVEALPLPAPSASPSAAAVKPSSPRAPAPRRTVALVFSPIDAEVFQDGKSLGGMPVTVPVAKGEVVTVEIRRDGFYPEKTRLDGSRPVVVVKLGSIPGVQPKIPVPAGSEAGEALKRASAAAAKAMLADAGAWGRTPLATTTAHPAAPGSAAPAAEPSAAAGATPGAAPVEKPVEATPSAAPAPPASAR
ncbi:MAG TPA: serine/threonine-protein kinase [Polyangiaceae bacterium]|jgi:serine/threonine-protein kinase|nr:serine/threonine-protein kinase [Polyangiaceae bacterium]